MMGSPVVHFEIGGPDHDALKKFYGDVFAWEIHDIPETNYSLVHTNADGKGIEGGMPVQEGPWVAVYIEVPDPQAALDKAVSAGAEVVMPVTEMPQVTLALFKDPAGNTVGIVKAEPQS